MYYNSDDDNDIAITLSILEKILLRLNIKS